MTCCCNPTSCLTLKSFSMTEAQFPISIRGHRNTCTKTTAYYIDFEIVSEGFYLNFLLCLRLTHKNSINFKMKAPQHAASTITTELIQPFSDAVSAKTVLCIHFKATVLNCVKMHRCFCYLILHLSIRAGPKQMFIL